MNARTHTPDRKEIAEGGRTVTAMTLKRCCNGCGQSLGDADDRDVDRRGNLTDVRGECDHCAPLVALEAAGCKTWQLTRRTIGETSFARWKRYAGPLWETDAEGRRTLAGLEFTADPGHEPVTVLWGDWIIRHLDGHFTIHKAPAEVAS